MDSANQYLLNLRKDKVTAEMEKTWDKEIMDAENKRIADITAMDIMKTRSTASSSDQAAEMDVLEFTSEELWIQLGLDLEEKQWAYSFSIHLDELLICHRIEIQDKVRRLGKDPRDEDRSAIERDRQVLQVQMEIFATKKAELGILEHNIHSPRDALPGAFDDIDNEEQASATIDPAQEPATIPLEHFTLALPSAMPDDWTPNTQCGAQITHFAGSKIHPAAAGVNSREVVSILSCHEESPSQRGSYKSAYRNQQAK